MKTLLFAFIGLACLTTTWAGQPQTLCPVMEGRAINRMLFVDHQGYRIYVCCIPCVKAIKRNPDKYLEKLIKAGYVPEKTPPEPSQ